MSTPAAVAEQNPYGPALKDRILASFRGRIHPVKVPLLYRFGLLVVAVTMILLPLVYVALIGLAGYGVYYHATNDVTIFEHVRPAKLALLAYAGPLFIGVVLVFFMIKPLFARPPRPRPPRALKKGDEPLLFAYVKNVCAAVGAPMPRRIDVDCQVNASASFRHGWMSFLSQDLVLTLGLPLVRGLTLQQLTGVLAHEFGHFSQGAGMRLTYVIRSVSHWFMRVVYERDSWDQKLASASESNSGLATAAVLGAQAMVWLTRRILWGLMWIGHVISCFMLRQMEFDADRYEARMVGGETFESTCRELSNLGVAYQKTLSDLGHSWTEGRLVDNLPGLVEVNRRAFAPELVGHIQSQVDAGSTGLFDTHPSDPDRIANARREGEGACFESDLEARVLFRDFDKLAASVSLDFYRDSLDEGIQHSSLQDLDAVEARQAEEIEELKSLGSFFQGTVHALHPWPLTVASNDVPARGREAVVAELAETRNALLARGAGHREELARYEEADGERLKARQAQELAEAGVRFSAADFGLASADVSAAGAKERAAQRRLEQLDDRLAEVEALAARRVQLALELPEALGEDAEQAPRLQAAVEALHALKGRLDKLRIDTLALARLGSVIQENPDNEKVGAGIQRLAKRLHEHLSVLRENWDTVAYPLDHADPTMTISGFAVPVPPDASDLGQLFGLAQETLNRSFNLYPRVMGRLGRLAEKAEARLGFDPLPEPSED